MSFNLLSVLTEEDRTKIENYIRLYGTQKNFIGLDNWLSYWSTNKIKMYKMLGNQLIYRVPFEYNKSKEELNNQIAYLVKTDRFIPALKDWIKNNDDIFPSYVYSYIYTCTCTHIFILDEVRENFKFTLEGNKKTLQLQKGMKPLRALGRFITYCKDVKGADIIKDYFEQFRIAHSIIFNDKTIKGNLAISIHPLDFMTMSDNNSNWQSCMSWKENGCYHVGTVEMMNSNNVLCCYLESSEPYYFSKDGTKDENYRWYNKKWRQLVYFTKDIIVSGKSYPYANDDISKLLITIICNFAKKNLKWTYSFGPELYQDMKYLYTKYSMDRARDYIHWGNMTKHNIIFDTKGMYNDMLNDHETNYWCIRNKVKHNKIISYSGKAPCLCCGEDVIYRSYDDYDYNERYSNCGSVVCDDCLDEFRCDFCDCREAHHIHYTVTLENGSTFRICDQCAKQYLRKCPDCGRTFFVTFAWGSYNIFSEEDMEYPFTFIKLEDEIDPDEFNNYYITSKKEKLDRQFNTVYPICRCKHCMEKDDRFERKEFKADNWSDRKKTYILSKESQKKEDWEKYFVYNLEPVDICDGELITN